MIAYLQGTILPASEESVIINARGVGYEVFVSQFTFEALLGQASGQLWIHTAVRDDAIQLFGFISRAEKDLFLSLIKVNGVGPKGAMKILSGAPTLSLMQMIEDGDVRALSGLPKVGKKTAEQIVLQLKGKLVLQDEQGVRTTGFSARSDIISALVNLGFKANEVEKVVDQMDAQISLEDGVRKGLGTLSAQF